MSSYRAQLSIAQVALIKGDTCRDYLIQNPDVFVSAEAPKSKVVLVSDQSQTGQWTFSGYAPLRSSAVEFFK